MPRLPENFDQFLIRCVEPTTDDNEVLHAVVSPIVSPGDKDALNIFRSGGDVSNIIPPDIIGRAQQVIEQGGYVLNLIGLPPQPGRARSLAAYHNAVVEPLTNIGCITRYVQIDPYILQRVGDLQSKYSEDYVKGIKNSQARGNFHSVTDNAAAALYGFKGPTFDDFEGFSIADRSKDPELDDYIKFWEGVFNDTSLSLPANSPLLFG